MSNKKLEGIDAAKKLAAHVQPLAGALDDMLKEMAGERVSFVLMMSIGQVTSYCANVDRPQGMDLLQELLDRWRAGRADIPAHYNPDLQPDALMKESYRHADGTIDWGAVDHELRAILDREGDIMKVMLPDLRTLLRRVSKQ